MMDGRPVGGIFSVGVEEPHRWKDSVQSEAEIRLWVASGTAQGMRPWFAKFAGVLRDRRWLPVVERIYDWHHRARALPAQHAIAGAGGAALLRADGRRVYAPGRGGRVADHVAGMYHALVEARVPFELVHEAFLTPEALDRSCARRARQRRGAVGRPVRGAPRLRRRAAAASLATFESSLYDESGARRPDFGLGRRVRRPRHRRRRGPDAELLPDARGRGRGPRHDGAARPR